MKKLLSLILILAMALSMVTVSYAADLSANLVAHWDFDDLTDGIITDVTGNGYDLVIRDTNYTVVTGFTGSAIDFKTEDQLGANSFGVYNGAMHATAEEEVLKNMNDALNGLDGISVSFWIRREKNGSSAKNAVFSFSPNGAAVKISAERFDYCTETRSASNGQGVSVNRYYPNGNNVDFYPLIGSSDGPNRHAWLHVTAVNDYANKKVRVYLDGELINEDTPANWNTDVTNFTLNAEGKGYIGVGEANSVIDDVKVYNKALTAQEVKEAVPPVLQYDFDEITNNTVANKSGIPADLTTTGTMTSVKGVGGDTAKVSAKATMPGKTFYNSMFKTKRFAFSTWAKLDDGVLSTNGSGQALFQEGKGGFNAVLNADGKVRFGVRSQAGDAYNGVYSTAPVFTAGDTSWHHIAGIVDYPNETLKLYVDGALNNTAELTNAFQADFYNMPGDANAVDYIDYANTANVVLDSLKLYRRALTEAEIVAMASELPFAEPTFTTTSTAVIANCNIANMSGMEIGENEAMLILAAYDIDTGLLSYAERTYLPALAVGGRATNVSVAITGLDEPANYTYKLLAWGINDLISYQNEIVYGE